MKRKQEKGTEKIRREPSVVEFGGEVIPCKQTQLLPTPRKVEPRF